MAVVTRAVAVADTVRVGTARVHTVAVMSKVATPVVVVLSCTLLTYLSYRWWLWWPAGRLRRWRRLLEPRLW